MWEGNADLALARSQDVGKLTALTVAKIAKSGRIADGEGLYLSVTPTKKGALSKSWLVRFKGAGGRWREAGLGKFPEVSLAQARERAAAMRETASSGHDPLVERDATRAEIFATQEAAKVAIEKPVTFRDCAEAYVAAHEPMWRNAKHAWQWTNTLRRLAYPKIGDAPVADIDRPLVLSVLDPVWRKTPETANRLRGRIELILSWAKVRGLRDGENPAAWRGNLQHALPAPAKIRPVKHHAALPHDQAPAFMAQLAAETGLGARALEFTILTAARTGEVIGMTWAEWDRRARTWTVPADRMKAGKLHRVPLSEAATELLAYLDRFTQGPFVFPGQRAQRPLSNMVMLMQLRRMGYGHLTAHGFRSTFRDWAAEQTNFPGEVVEAALAHAVGNKVEAAYRRGDLFEKRRALMEAWAHFLGQKRYDNP